jgi:mRNA-degrading endonuclease toxin of MazEF toxin-antitoxin module
MKRCEIWRIDFGMTAKVLPGVVLSLQYRDNEKAVAMYVARSTPRHGGRFEVERCALHYLPGVFDAPNLWTVPATKLNRRLGALRPAKLAEVERATRGWLGLAAA